MVRLRDSCPFSLSSAPTVGNPCRPLQPESVSLGLKGKICRNWALNPHPALIPAIEAGFVENVHSFGSELGMEAYIRARSDVFFTGPDGALRSNRALCQAAGHCSPCAATFARSRPP